MQPHLEYTASSCIVVNQPAFGCLVPYSVHLSGYSRDVFIGGGENLQRQADCIGFPCINIAECTEQATVLTASTFEPNIEHTLGLQAVLWSTSSKCPLFLEQMLIKCKLWKWQNRLNSLSIWFAIFFDYIFVTLPKHFYQGWSKRIAH